jgi:prepilin-type N-terminal cleavage/methylation domain-containing protein
MKLSVAHPSRVRLPARQSRGFTLVEVMIATALMLSCIIGGLIAVNMMGLQEERLLESKAGASDTTRMNIHQLINAIYAAKGWQIGTWTNGVFTGITNGAYQQGNAWISYPLIITTNQIVNLSIYDVYYFDSSQVANYNGCLWYFNSTNSANYVLVSNLIAPLYFTSEKYDGTTNTVQTYKGVVHATFQFAQFQYPLTPVGSNDLFNSYRIDVRATPHLPDGA